MIVKIYLFVLLYAYFSFDVYGTDNMPIFSPKFGQQNENVMQQQLLPLQAHFNDERTQIKPCNRPGFHANEWVNTYKRRLVQPSSNKNMFPSNTDLVPQSLKNDDYQDSKSRRSGFDLDYKPEPLPNIFIDKNDDFTDQYHDSELRKENQDVRDRVSDLCKNCNNKLSIVEVGQNSETSNNKLLCDTDTTGFNKTQNSKTLKSGDLFLWPGKARPLKNSITVEPKSSKQDNMLEQSRRFLHNDDGQHINLPSKNLHEKSDSEHLNNEPYQSSNIYEPVEKPQFESRINNGKDEIPDPTKGVGKSRLSETKVLLSRSSRVCYACTSATNPSCKIPDRQTTVKYCRKDHNACVTKTFEVENSMVVIRDCASSCDVTKTPSITPKYKSCVICHSDLCNDTNGAYSINSHSLIVCLVVISFIRGTF